MEIGKFQKYTIWIIYNMITSIYLIIYFIKIQKYAAGINRLLKGMYIKLFLEYRTHK
jgi:hypothetical protein